jgi:hypothetical protein
MIVNGWLWLWNVCDMEQIVWIYEYNFLVKILRNDVKMVYFVYKLNLIGKWVCIWLNDSFI